MSRDMNLSSCQSSWCVGPRFRSWGLCFLAALALFEGVWTVFCRDNDFLWHRHHAEYFLQGRPNGQHYLPARGFMDIPLAIAPYQLTRAVVYCLAIAMLLVCYRIWSNLAAQASPVAADSACPAAILTVL